MRYISVFVPLATIIILASCGQGSTPSQVLPNTSQDQMPSNEKLGRFISNAPVNVIDEIQKNLTVFEEANPETSIDEKSIWLTNYINKNYLGKITSQEFVNGENIYCLANVLIWDCFTARDDANAAASRAEYRFNKWIGTKDDDSEKNAFKHA